MQTFARSVLAAGIAAAGVFSMTAVQAAPFVSFNKVWTHFASISQSEPQADVFDESAAEIVAYDPDTQRVFVVNGDVDRVDVLDADDGAFLGFLDVSGFGGPNSVAVKNGIVAVAVEDGTSAQADGNVVFFDAADAGIGTGGTSTAAVPVGPLPDMVTFTPDGSKVLVANEGEPDFYGQDGTDPEGSISIVDISGGVGGASVSTAGFTGFNKPDLVTDGVRITGPGTGGASEATAAQDIEPEYIAVSEDGSKAYVTLQENNAVAVVDIDSATIEEVRSLGFKDHGVDGNGLDASDRDNMINIRTWDNVKGMPMPDSIGAYTAGGKTYYVTANEGDAREYDVPAGSTGIDYTDETRVKDVTLGAGFPANAQDDDQLGRLQMSSVDLDGSTPTTYDEIMSFGTRSFSIWDGETGDLIWDSGDFFEQLTAGLVLTDQDGNPVFNSDNDGNDSFDSRSDAKGPEPEALVIGQIYHNTLAFVGLERIGGIVVFDITNPASPIFLDYLLDRDFTVDATTMAAGDIGPEGLYFVTPNESPFGRFGLVVANEVSGTTSWYNIQVPLPAPLLLFGAGLPLLLLARRR
ncbi:choice-of-anchor I family protein [uncultured Thiohalocapsa sp.]|uniref:choice-of-anchor I family protein n=1 Tax=uncultured Thiohalocapsa sp. TaxID=768990 RepID=UPI0025DA22D8|nr:choice-of-anchor I family protein [uncultured Thiohalocapsa sp.]